MDSCICWSCMAETIAEVVLWLSLTTIGCVFTRRAFKNKGL